MNLVGLYFFSFRIYGHLQNGIKNSRHRLVRLAGGFVSNHVRNLIYEEQSLSAQSHELWFSLFQWLIAQAMA